MSGTRIPQLRTAALTAWLSIAVLVVSCGSSTLSLPEYVDRLNAVVAEGNERIRPLYAELESPGEPDVVAVQELFEQEAAIRTELQSAFSDIAAPEQIAELHAALIEWHGELIVAQKSLAGQVANAASWSEFQRSPEYAAFDDLMQEGLAGCLELQAALDATEARGGFADAPWIPGELKEVVDAALGCDVELDG